MRCFIFVATLAISASPLAAAPPLVESYLAEGKLSEGTTSLEEHLKANPNDDEARFGLGMLQFFQAAEHFTNDLYRFGVRTEDSLRGMPKEIRAVLPQNPNPEKMSYQDARKMTQRLVKEVRQAEQTLSAIKATDVKLPLHVGQIKVDITGQGKPVDAAFLLSSNGTFPKETVDDFVINFDRGDVDWLAGYCNFICANGEVLLAVETEELFHCTAHLFFQDIDTPHKFLLEGNRNLDSVRNFNRPLISDIIAYLHLWRFEVKEPARMQTALAHLEDMQAHAVKMWAAYRLETDDEREWIPNPDQTGVMQVKVSEEMMLQWLEILVDTDLVLKGETLLPFWRGTPGKQGVNFRKIFTEPTNLDPFLWWQGTAATPYLEKGKITELANPERRGEINRVFGSWNFMRFAVWFN